MEVLIVTGFLHIKNRKGLELLYDELKIKYKIGSINDIKATFLVDTGASNSCLSIESKDLYNLKTQGEKFEASGASDKKMEAILSKECKFKLGRFLMKKQKFVLLDLNHINSLLESQNIKKIDGIIGAEFLKANKAVIDYDNLNLFLKS